jgi:hypothetical protein
MVRNQFLPVSVGYAEKPVFRIRIHFLRIRIRKSERPINFGAGQSRSSLAMFVSVEKMCCLIPVGTGTVENH